jgi:hypothetical protein
MERYSITHEVSPEAENLRRRQTVAEVTTTNKTKQAPRCQKGNMKHSSININGTANDELTRDNTPSALPDERKASIKACGKITIAAVGLALLGIAGSSLRGDDGKHEGSWKTLVIDLAEDARTEGHINVNGADAELKRGYTFIVSGKLYPGGTIPAGDGLDIDTLTGSIGTWHPRNFQRRP